MALFPYTDFWHNKSATWPRLQMAREGGYKVAHSFIQIKNLEVTTYSCPPDPAVLRTAVCCNP